MNKEKFRKLAERVRLQISDFDLIYFKKSFSAVLPMVSKLLSEKIADNISTVERIVSTPLSLSELSRIRNQLNVNILSAEKIKTNSFLKGSKIVIKKKYM